MVDAAGLGVVGIRFLQARLQMKIVQAAETSHNTGHAGGTGGIGGDAHVTPSIAVLALAFVCHPASSIRAGMRLRWADKGANDAHRRSEGMPTRLRMIIRLLLRRRASVAVWFQDFRLTNKLKHVPLDSFEYRAKALSPGGIDHL